MSDVFADHSFVLETPEVSTPSIFALFICLLHVVSKAELQTQHVVSVTQLS